MLRRHWCAYCAAIGIAFGLLAFEKPTERNARYQDGADSSYGEIQAERSPLILPLVQARIKSISESLEGQDAYQEAARDKRDKANLKAQKRIARAAARTTTIAAVETVITLVGLILIGLTLRASWAAAGEAKRSADEARRQADYAGKALAQTKESAESDLRAWVDAKAELFSFNGTPNRASIGIEVKIVNVGKTPALNVATSEKVRAASAIVHNGGGLPVPEKWPSAMPSLMPGKDAEQRVGLRISGENIEACIKACKADSSALMVVVDIIAYYRTIFDQPNSERRMTSIRYYIHPALSVSPPDNDHSRNWIQNVDGAGEVKFAHGKSAPVYMT